LLSQKAHVHFGRVSNVTSRDRDRLFLAWTDAAAYIGMPDAAAVLTEPASLVGARLECKRRRSSRVAKFLNKTLNLHFAKVGARGRRLIL
jgi:hypothetical protein